MIESKLFVDTTNINFRILGKKNGKVLYTCRSSLQKHMIHFK